GGRPRILRLLKTPVKDSQGVVVGVLGISWDVTEQRALEAQLRQAQKLEAIGRLAGGGAHGFNELLTGINGYGELVLEGLDRSDPSYGVVEQIARAGERAAALTRQLLAFSRKQVLEPKVLNLNTLVTDVEKLLRRLIGENIQLIAVLDPALGQVKADPGQ